MDSLELLPESPIIVKDPPKDSRCLWEGAGEGFSEWRKMFPETARRIMKDAPIEHSKDSFIWDRLDQSILTSLILSEILPGVLRGTLCGILWVSAEDLWAFPNRFLRVWNSHSPVPFRRSSNPFFQIQFR